MKARKLAETKKESSSSSIYSSHPPPHSTGVKAYETRQTQSNVDEESMENMKSITPHTSARTAVTSSLPHCVSSFLSCLVVLESSSSSPSSCIEFFNSVHSLCSHPDTQQVAESLTPYLPRLYACLYRVLHTYSLHSSHSSDSSLTRSSLRCLGYFLHHPTYVKALDSIGDMLRVLCALIQSSSDKLLVCISLWVISEQSLVSSSIDSSFPPLLLAILAAIQRFPTTQTVKHEAVHALGRIAEQCPTQFIQLSSSWIPMILPLTILNFTEEKEFNNNRKKNNSNNQNEKKMNVPKEIRSLSLKLLSSLSKRLSVDRPELSETIYRFTQENHLVALLKKHAEPGQTMEMLKIATAFIYLLGNQ